MGLSQANVGLIFAPTVVIDSASNLHRTSEAIQRH